MAALGSFALALNCSRILARSRFKCRRRRIIETGVARTGGRVLRRHEGGVAQKSEDHLSAGGADDLVVGGIKIRPGRRELRAIDSSSQWFGQTQI